MVFGGGLLHLYYSPSHNHPHICPQHAASMRWLARLTVHRIAICAQSHKRCCGSVCRATSFGPGSSPPSCLCSPTFSYHILILRPPNIDNGTHCYPRLPLPPPTPLYPVLRLTLALQWSRSHTRVRGEDNQAWLVLVADR